jgi:hypothetical protein
MQGAYSVTMKCDTFILVTLLTLYFSVQRVLLIITVNWRVNAIAQNNKNTLYKHGCGNVSLTNLVHYKVFSAASDKHLTYAKDN